MIEPGDCCVNDDEDDDVDKWDDDDDDNEEEPRLSIVVAGLALVVVAFEAEAVEAFKLDVLDDGDLFTTFESSLLLDDAIDMLYNTINKQTGQTNRKKVYPKTSR